MNIFVINLEEDAQRRESITKQLNDLGLAFEILPGVKGKDLTESERGRHLDDRWFRRYEGRPAQPGELGCSLSHIHVYRLVAERNLDHALVLEDDAWLNPNLPQLLDVIAERYRPESKNVVLLTWYRAIELSGFDDLWASYHVARVSQAVCAHGYVVTRGAAQTLVQNLYPVRHVADCWNWLRRHRIVNVLAVFPTCITVDMSFDVRTTPELNNPRDRGPVWERLRRKIHRGFWLAIDHIAAWTRIRALRP